MFAIPLIGNKNSRLLLEFCIIRHTSDIILQSFIGMMPKIKQLTPNKNKKLRFVPEKLDMKFKIS